MQNKGLVKLFAILFGLVSIYQLSFTYIASRVEGKAVKFAEETVPSSVPDYNLKREQVQSKYLDSLANETVYNIGIAKYTYKEVKDRELNQGLDLKGGINVTLQISVRDILKGLADNSQNPIFEKSLVEADKGLRETDRTYLDLFFEAFEKNGGRLSAPDVFGNKTLSGVVNYQMSNNEVRPIIRNKVDESIVSAFEVLRKRIDKFGVSNPNIQRLGNSGRILVELPGAKDVTRVKSLLQSTAQLEFWETYKAGDMATYFDMLNTHFKSQLKGDETTTQGVVKPESEIDSLLADVEKDSVKQANEINPIYDLIKLGQGVNVPSLGFFSASDTTKLMSYLRSEEGKRLLPAEMKYAKFVFGKPHKLADLNQLYASFVSLEQEKAAPAEAKKMRDELATLLRKSDLVELYALKGNRENQPPLNGSVITDAVQTYDQNHPCVSMTMDTKGAKIWETLTGKAYIEKGNIAIVLDNIVYSAPGVSRGAISGGNSQITGNFTVLEAQDLANVLRAGKLPASADVVQSEVVGPSLGQEAIDSGFLSFVIAILFIFAWVIFYYGRSGIYANIALIFNVLLIFGVLASLEAVLTLPGIAGIVLTIGMAIDSNVLIYERIKEELFKGKSQAESIKDGFGNALSSILDANITTFLTAVVLLIFGSGPIKGFATTLIVGIITTLFTAIFITRLFLDKDVAKNRKVSFWTPPTKNFLRGLHFRFIRARKISYTLSAIVVIVCLSSIFVKGFDQGIDFSGGRSYQIRFQNPVKTTEIAAAVRKSLGNVEVKTFGAANQVKLTTKYKYQEESTAVDNEIQEILHKDLQPFMGQSISYEEFMSGEGLGIMKSDKIGPSIAEDIKSGASYAVLGSLLVIFLYILFRFRKWQFSLGAVAALVHNVIVVLGVFSLFYTIMPFSLEIDQSFIAAILTVIGYTINDTVVIYDRIREVVKENGWSRRNLDIALSTTLSRTINTSVTTLFVLVTIFIFGGESLRGFMFAMIIGIVAGTYTSIFIATPIVYDTLKLKNEELKSRDED